MTVAQLKSQRVFKTRTLIIAFTFVCLFAAYAPVMSGYYLLQDDYWGFTYEYRTPFQNPMFHTQAFMAGRPVGAFVMSTLHLLIGKVSDANVVRGFLVLLLCLIALGLANWLMLHGIRPLYAGLAAVACATLPCFHSPVSCITDGYAVYGILPTMAAGYLVRKALFENSSRSLQRMLLVASFSLLLLSLLTYPITAMFYWTMMAVLILHVPNAEVLRQGKKILLVLLMPMFAVGTYFVYFRLTQFIYSESEVATNLWERLGWFVSQPLPLVLNLWHRPQYVLSSEGMVEGEASWNVLSIAISIVFVIGMALALVREYRISRSSSERWGMAVKYCLLAGLVPLTVLPFIFAAKWPYFAYRYSVALLPLFFLALMWSVGHCLRSLRVSGTSFLPVILLAMVTAIGSASAYHDLRQYVVTPLSKELEFYKSALRQEDLLSLERVHVLKSRRKFPYREAFGLQSSFGKTGYGWAPALVTTAIKELSREDDAFLDAKDKWTVQAAISRVTRSYPEALRQGTIGLDPEETLILDTRELEFLIEPYMEPKSESPDSSFEGMPRSADDKDYTANLCVHGRALSGGDYEGFPASQAFDADPHTSQWASRQVGPEITHKAYLGYDFGPGRTHHIRRIRIRQGGAIPRVILQSGEDGSTWVDIQTLDLARDNNTYTFDIGQSRPARFWRVFADLPTAEGPAAWTVYELEMMEKVGDLP